MKVRKSWSEKLNNPNLPKVIPIPPEMEKRLGTGTMLIPSPLDVQAFVRGIPEGSVTTVSEIRNALARKYVANTTCPLVMGISLRLTAEAAEESAATGKPDGAPYWRVVKDDGSLNPKFPGGTERQTERLRAEGHRISPGSGKRPARVVLAPNT